MILLIKWDGTYDEAASQWKRAFKWESIGYHREDGEDVLFVMESAVDAYEKAGLVDKAEAMRERGRKWEEHWRWYWEMSARGEDCEVICADEEDDDDEYDGDDDEYDGERQQRRNPTWFFSQWSRTYIQLP